MSVKVYSVGDQGQRAWALERMVATAALHSHTKVTLLNPSTLTPQIGPRDVASGTCAIARRDRPGKEGKEFGVPLAPELLVQEVLKRLDEVQAELLERATRFRDEHILDVSSHSQFLEVIEQGEVFARWGSFCAPHA